MLFRLMSTIAEESREEEKGLNKSHYYSFCKAILYLPSYSSFVEKSSDQEG